MKSLNTIKKNEQITNKITWNIQFSSNEILNIRELNSFSSVKYCLFIINFQSIYRNKTILKIQKKQSRFCCY